jgi:hypothetical protein
MRPARLFGLDPRVSGLVAASAQLLPAGFLYRQIDLSHLPRSLADTALSGNASKG